MFNAVAQSRRADRTIGAVFRHRGSVILTRLFKFSAPRPAAAGEIVIARLNARAQPIDRGEVFEDPLDGILQAAGIGNVSGGGTQLGEEGEIQFCDLEITVPEASDAVLAAIRKALEVLGAPKGSRLIWNDGANELEFGSFEGLAVYLNGTDLPESVYEQCDVDVVYEEFGKLVGAEGRVVSLWQGPTETALYLYGRSVETMLSRIRPFLDTYPLCAKARTVKIA
jgi:hypothetical protein